jgi:signal transduction histidine kinase
LFIDRRLSERKVQMLRNLGIRWQILSALALPVLVLGLISSQVTYQALVDMREANQSRDLAQAAGGFADLVGGLQAERALSVATVLGQTGAQTQLKTVRVAVDEGLAAIRSRVYSDSSSDAVKAVLARSASAHASLSALRSEVDTGKVQSRAIVARYSAVIVVDVEVPADLASTLRSQKAAANFQQFAQLSRAGEALAQEQLVGATAIMNGRADTVDQRELGAVEAAGQLALDAFARSASAAQQKALKAALAAPAARSLNLSTARAAFRFAGTVNRPDVRLADWTAITSAQLAALRGALNSVNADGVAVSSSEYNSARSKLQLTLGGAIAITLVTLLLALGLSRRIAAPLRRLTQAATQIRDELPKIVASAQTDEDFELDLPVVQIAGHNEVSRLAAAFVDVNAVTVAIAREQARLRAAVADMFVNVARRNQVLLSRQLSLIDQLERNEVNPDALEELFRLDHLATRMRRNAESLLVLAGIESGRRLREPMPLSDVVRTATSEIEHYSRVSLSLTVDPPVFAHLALPIAHLLAELLENATNFSDPGSTVVVMASPTDQGIRMTVADDGLGIPPEELLEINARIDEPPTAEALSSQRLGFFVVGRLAQRLDAKVTLTSGRARGTAVLVDLPSSLFVPGALGETTHDRPALREPVPTPALPSVPEQGGAPDRTPQPVAALTAGSPFVAAFPSPTTAEAPVPAMAAATLGTVPAAFNSAAFDAENALEPVWTPQPDLPPSDHTSAPAFERPASSGLPARRSAAPAADAPTVPQLLPLPSPPATVEPMPTTPIALPMAEPAATAVAPAPARGTSVEGAPEWAESDWAVSEWTPDEVAAPEPAASSAPVESRPAPPESGPSLFSGFRSRQAAVEPETTPAPPVDPPAARVAPPVVPNPSAAEPVTFLDSATAVDDWFEAAPATEPFAPSASSPEADQWQAWDEVASDESVPAEPAASPAVPAPATKQQDDEADPSLPARTSRASQSAPLPAASTETSVSWAAEPDLDESNSVAWTSPVDTYVADPIDARIDRSDRADLADLESDDYPTDFPAIPQTWTPEPVVFQTAAEDRTPEAEAWAPAPAAEIWAPEPAAGAPVSEPSPETWSAETRSAEPVVEAWAPEPAAEVWALEPAAEAWAPEPVAPPWTPGPAVQAWAPEPATDGWASEPAAEGWAPEPAAEAWVPEPATATWAPEPAAEAQAPETAAEVWAPEPAAEVWTPAPAVQAWAPEPEGEEPAAVWAAEPAVEAWTPEPVTTDWAPESTAAWAPEPTTEVWAPETEPESEPAPEAWAPEPAAEAWVPDAAPEAWNPEPAADAKAAESVPPAWGPEPEAWTPEPEPEPETKPAGVEPLKQTLSAAIDILPQRTSLRTALRRGRRKGDPQPSDRQPFNGGFDPIAPAREFARREGFGSTVEPEPAPAEPTGAAASGLVPEPTRTRESTGHAERRQYPRTGDQPSPEGRSALASEALTELSRLSSYSPTSMPSADSAGLQRRTPGDVPVDESVAPVESSGRTRTAASVRSMLAGFKAGVERGRTSPSANRPASPAMPPPPRASSTEEP